MAEFAVGKNHPGQKRAKRGREPHQHHQKRNRHHDQQGKRRVHFTQARGVDKAKHRSRQVNTGENDRDHRADGDKRGPPTRKACDQRLRHLMRAGCAVIRCFGLAREKLAQHHIGGFRQRQKRQEGQHRDHCDILCQQHRKRRAPAPRPHQPLFRQGLQNDRRRGECEDEADRKRHTPAKAQKVRPGHDRQRGQNDLQAAKT